MQYDYICMKGETTEFGKRKRNGSLHSTPFKMMIVVLFAGLVLLQTTEAAYGTKVVRRGFKSSLLSTARGFGKRSPTSGFVKLLDRGIIPTTAIGFGKRSPLSVPLYAPLRQKTRNDVNPQELSSLGALHDASQNEFDMDSMMRQLNLEALKNPRMIPLVLELIRSGMRPEDDDTDAHATGYDDLQ